MNKITLEACALALSIYGSADMVDLIRAAQKVVDAAEQVDGELITFEGCLLLAVTPELVDDLKEAITAFRKLEEGEQPCAV